MVTSCTPAQMQRIVDRHNQRSFENVRQERAISRTIRNFNNACSVSDCSRFD